MTFAGGVPVNRLARWDGAQWHDVAGGVTKSLPGAQSASGARYAAGDFEIWGKGDNATLSGFPGGPYNNCRVG